MKLFTSLILSMVLFQGVNAQKDNTAKFDAGVMFGSKCCGTSSDSFLRTFLTDYQKINKVKISSYKAAGCGKEGEFKIMFCLSELKETMKADFKKELQSKTEAEEKKNQAADSSSGNINIAFDIKPEDYEYCRIALAKW